MKRLLFFMALFVGLCTQCTKNSESKLSVDVKEIIMGFEGGEAFVNMTSDVVSHSRIDYEGEFKDWVTLEPSSLQGSGQMKVVVSENEKYLTPRAAKLVIVAPNAKVEIPIAQEGNPNKPKPFVKIDKRAFSADVEGAVYTVNVTSNGEWSVVSTQDWCKVKDGKGAGDGKFTIEVAPSVDYQYRTADVAVSVADVEPLVIHVEHVGTKIGNTVWANSNVNEPDTFGENCEVRGKLYQWNSKYCYETHSKDNGGEQVPIPGFDDPSHVEKLKGLEWKEENDPCPDGWRVPTIEEIRTLIGASMGGDGKWNASKSWYDFDKENGMAVSGAFVGLPFEDLKKCNKENMNGAIFLPQAGTIYDHQGQTDWWSIRLWSSSNFAEGDVFAKFSVNIATYGVDPSYWTEVKEAATVRCVKK